VSARMRLTVVSNQPRARASRVEREQRIATIHDQIETTRHL
jgi:hypothetical protein